MSSTHTPGDDPAPATKIDKVAEAMRRIAEACHKKLGEKLLTGKVPIPPARAMKVSRMAPPMRAAQAGSYARTGKPLKLPRYRDVIDAATAQTEAASEKADASALARILNDVQRLPAAGGGDINIPPLDTEHVHELTDRLDRALGLVAKVVVDLARLHQVRPSAEAAAIMLQRTGDFIRYARFIEDLLKRPAVRKGDSLRPLPGTYVVLLHLPEDTQFPRVGPFGSERLPMGFYTYTGTAFGSGGVEARVGYHAIRSKEHLLWHLDYVRPAVKVMEVWVTYDRKKRECPWAKLIYEALGGTVLVPGFGSADCKKLPAGVRCQAHFCHFEKRPFVEAFARAVFAATPDHAHIEVVDGSAVEPSNVACSPIDAQEENA